jgi:beta-adrenergic-receptor kinase
VSGQALPSYPPYLKRPILTPNHELSSVDDSTVHSNALQLSGNDPDTILRTVAALDSMLSSLDSNSFPVENSLHSLSRQSAYTDPTAGVGAPHDEKAPSSSSSSSPSPLPKTSFLLQDTLFDQLDLAIFMRVKRRYEKDFFLSTYWKRYISTMIQAEKPVNLDDFYLFRTLGRGGFGLVNGCKKCQSGHLYAIKALDRKRIKKKKATDLCLNERNILEKINSPFIVCMQYAFTSPVEIYIILDLMVGGDLGFHLHQRGVFTHEETKYYIARTILGIKALHDIQVVYRDLKPENILMDSKGRTKISDLGLSCEVTEKGLCGAYGTRGYWAPEMLQRDEKGHRVRYRYEVDWFSLGCVFHEFIIGASPFKTDAARSIGGSYRGLCKEDMDVRIDTAIQGYEPTLDESYFTPEAKDLCYRLLRKRGHERLGYRGAEEIMAHPYFKDLNWDDLISDVIPPPSVPRRDLNIASQDEIGQFKDKNEAKKMELTPEDLLLFSEWDFVRQSAVEVEVVKFMQYEEIHVSTSFTDLHFLLLTHGPPPACLTFLGTNNCSQFFWSMLLSELRRRLSEVFSHDKTVCGVGERGIHCDMVD